LTTAPLDYDEPVKISALVTRVLAGNPGFMTGPGTNTYLVGHHDIAVIDPGPFDDSHVRSIIEAAGDKRRIKWIFITHTHPDHSPGAKLLKAQTGAPLLGLPPPTGIDQDYGFKPDRVLSHNEQFQTDEFNLKVIHTPGHASNHLCFLLENENLLFSGDHIMQGSTVVIIPPYGHMRNYLDSLSLLKNYAIDRIAPGHGYIIDDPFAEVESIIEHRLQREAKVISALKKEGRASIDQILPFVYDDVHSFMHGVAAFSLEAHLIKLEEDGTVARDHNIWFFTNNE
jgi:glyoxylase-like metal-dependent hydrolase (beta-lactamase superfamily II)